MLKTLIEAAKRIENEGIFLGGPSNSFTRVGRNQLIALLDCGMTPDSKLLDVGCGCLRGGYWAINFLESGNYFGIEPNKAMLNSGLNNLFTTDFLDIKRPKFSHTDDFDLSVFDVRFDFVVARSIWSHASPIQIESMIESFALNSSDDGVLLVSYKEAIDHDQYEGEEWVGKSHQSTKAGIVYYKLDWIAEICKEHRLRVKEMYEDYGQIWLKIFRHGELQTIINREPRPGKILTQ